MVGGSTEQKQPLLLGMLTQLSQAWDWHWLHLLLKLQVPFLPPYDRRQLSLGTGTFVESWGQQLSRLNLRPPCSNRQGFFPHTIGVGNELALPAWQMVVWRKCYPGNSQPMLRPHGLSALQVAPFVTSCGRCVRSCRVPRCHCSCCAPALLSTRTR